MDNQAAFLRDQAFDIGQAIGRWQGGD